MNRISNGVFLLVVVALLSSACAVIEVTAPAYHVLSRQYDLERLKRNGIDSDDLRQLSEGNLLRIKEKYERQDWKSLSLLQKNLLCDIYVRSLFVDEAIACLDRLESEVRLSKDDDRNLSLDNILGKKALVNLMVGEYSQAESISSSLSSNAGVYLHALSRAKQGVFMEASTLAKRLSNSFEVKDIYLALNLFLVTKNCRGAVELAKNPARKFHRYYGLTKASTVLGFEGKPRQFRFDLFDEFQYGIFGFYSYAPRMNLYVEYIVARCAFENGNMKEAREGVDLILTQPSLPSYREINWMTLFLQARLSEAGGNEGLAIDQYKQAVNEVEAIRGSGREGVARIGFLDDPQKIYLNLIRLLRKSGNDNEALLYVDRSRSKEFSDWFSSVNPQAVGDADGEKYRERYVALARAEKKWISAGVLENIEESKVLRSGYERASREISRDAPRSASVLAISKPTFDDMLSALTPAETLITYHTNQNSIDVYILNYGDKDVSIVTIKETYQQTVKSLKELRNALGDTNSNEYHTQSLRMYKRYFKPVEKYIRQKNITISVAGAMMLMPFSVLHDGERYLVERFAIKTIPNIGFMSDMEYRKSVARGSLIIGNPLRKDEDPLGNAEREARAVSRTLGAGNTQLLLGSKATVTAFEKNVSDAKYVHIAAHAVFDKERPERSRILLAEINSKQKDSDVTVKELLEKYRTNAELVVLSACETSRVVEADRLIGLSIGFIVAGANGVIGSLWKIEDKSTATLMEEFYDQLGIGVAPQEALRKAQISLIKSDLSHPFYWAPFVYTGRTEG